MEEAPENGKESPHSVHANGSIDLYAHVFSDNTGFCFQSQTSITLLHPQSVVWNALWYVYEGCIYENWHNFYAYRQTAGARPTTSATKSRSPPRTDLYPDDENVGCFRSFSEFPWPYLFAFGWYNSY